MRVPPSLARQCRCLATAQLAHRLATGATDDATFGPRRILNGRGCSLAERPLALLCGKVGRDTQWNPKLIKELLGGHLARVEAHALAGRFLQELALFNDQPADLTVSTTVERSRAHQEPKCKGGYH